MTNESSGMEQAGMSVLCQGKEPVEEQRNRIRREEHSRRIQDTGPIGTCAQRKDHASDMDRRGTHRWFF